MEIAVIREMIKDRIAELSELQVDDIYEAMEHQDTETAIELIFDQWPDLSRDDAVDIADYIFQAKP